jgi:hypothetical protein
MRRSLSLLPVVFVVAAFALAAGPAQANTITPACSPSPSDCSAPWYVAPVDLSWTVDPDATTSTGCGGQTINETAAAGQTVTCSATWDTGDPPSVDQPVTIHVDLTNPTVDGATPSRAADSNGWFNHSLTFDFFGSDTPSGIDSCSQNVAYSGPDSALASANGSCTDNAGRTGNGSKTFKYDATNPVAVSASPARGPDHNGWYNAAVGFQFGGTDNLSGISSCQNVNYSGPNSGTATVSGHCTDVAGNVGSNLTSDQFQYDSTKPVINGATGARGADHNGWFNHSISFTFTGTDDTSGVDTASCQQKTYSGPDTASASVAGHCSDNAGNVGTDFTKSLQYDATKPTTSSTPTPDRAANSFGWYNAPVSFNFSGSDVTSGIESCPAGVSYSGPDSATATVSGHCTDNAGNDGNNVTSTSFKYDATKPTTTGATPARATDHNGWYNAPIGFTFTATDPLSGINTCEQKTYSGPDGPTASISGHCTDKAGNTGNDGPSASFKYDATKPTTNVPTPARVADHNGWYNAPVGFTFSGTDATSNIDTCPTGVSYGGPSSAGATVSGHCTDVAGNAGDNATSAPIQYDAVPPTVTGSTPARVPDTTSGWYTAPVSFTFNGTDAMSGIESCSTGVSYSGPDSATGSVTGHCTDNAGNNSANSQATLKYDTTPPTATGATPARAADSNGWFNHPVDFTFTGTDTASGIATCDTVSYTTGDSATASVSGHCTDKADHPSATIPHAFEYDATAPDTTGATLDRGADLNGWFNHPVTVNLTGTDATSGFAGPSCGSVVYAGPDGAGTHASGSCKDQAGNSDPTPFDSPVFNYDGSPPTVVGGVADRPPDRNGWYNHPVSFAFQGADNVSGLAGCSSGVGYAGPDSSAAGVAGACQDNAGNVATGAARLQYDQTPPTVIGALPQRTADHDGWFNHPVLLTFYGQDATSGVTSCSRYTFNSDQSSNAVVSGTCIDAAGNARTASFSMRYDATPPAPAQVTATPKNGRVALTWTKPADAVSVTVARARKVKASSRRTVYRGKATKLVDKHVRNGTTYLYTVTAIDRAGNASKSEATVKPTALSLRPLPGAVVASPPKLTWKHVRHARYYNVQLYLGRTKVLSVWPVRTSFQVESSWLYAGHSYSLVPGPYRWYVWPGIGPRRKNRYGHLIGKSGFTVIGPGGAAASSARAGSAPQPDPRPVSMLDVPRL